MTGIGLALLFVAAFHLVPAALTQSIPTTTAKRISRAEMPTQFWGTCAVMGAAALVGIALLLASLIG